VYTAKTEPTGPGAETVVISKIDTYGYTARLHLLGLAVKIRSKNGELNGSAATPNLIEFGGGNVLNFKSQARLRRSNIRILFLNNRTFSCLKR
jgi:hypothetical protein